MAQENEQAPWMGNLYESFGFQKQESPTTQVTEASGVPAWQQPESLWGLFSHKPNTPLQPAMKAPSRGSQGASGGMQATGGLSVTIDSVFPKLIQAESRGQHKDASGNLTTSPVGAKGITQVMPKSGKDPGYGVAPLKDESEGEYLRFGKELLTAYTKEFGGDIAKGLAAYNYGPGALKRVLNKHGENWRDNLPKETASYLTKILGTAVGAGNANAGELPKQPKSVYGKRNDGTEKGEGFFGPLKAKSGEVMTEFSVGVNIDGKEIEIPTFTPNQSKKDIDFMLSGGNPTDDIVRKAAEYARQRIKQGKSPFAAKGEQTFKVK